jgi:uncharacterized phiE125 gp8 family phage protein
MNLVLNTGPQSEPVTLDELRAQCRVLSHDEDALLAGYILRAREYVETYLDRALMAQTWDLKIHWGWPQDTVAGVETDVIRLPKPPLQSVTYIKYVDTNGVEQTLAANQYRVVGANDPQREAYIVPAYGVTWPTVRSDFEAVSVRFVCGYTRVPEAIKQAILLIATDWFENRSDNVVGQGYSLVSVPNGAKALLFPHRVFY